MAEVWPISLPQYLRVQGNSQGLGDARLWSDTETGPGKTRPRSSAVADPLTGTMLMTASQVIDLKTFWKTTLAQGSLPFEFIDPLTETTVLVRFAKSGPPMWNYLGPKYEVTLNLEILP